MARLRDLREFSRRHGIKMCSIEQIIQYRRKHERLVRRELGLNLPSAYGNFDLVVYSAIGDREPHLALCMGGIGVGEKSHIAIQREPILVRVHSECLIGDLFRSHLCDCGAQFHEAMKLVRQAGRGVVLYMRQEGRGIGLLSKLQACRLQQEEGLDTVEANHRLGFESDLRHYDVSAQILEELGIRRIRLLTNNPKKLAGLEGHNLEIVERVPLEITPNEINHQYLRTKIEKLGHLLMNMPLPAGPAS
jgi:3,4-dihydroxy 2-butanone 4-phosphate synthase / GTP cyclohydrolase II